MVGLWGIILCVGDRNLVMVWKVGYVILLLSEVCVVGVIVSKYVCQGGNIFW